MVTLPTWPPYLLNKDRGRMQSWRCFWAIGSGIAIHFTGTGCIRVCLVLHLVRKKWCRGNSRGTELCVNRYSTHLLASLFSHVAVYGLNQKTQFLKILRLASDSIWSFCFYSEGSASSLHAIFPLTYLPARETQKAMKLGWQTVLQPRHGMDRVKARHRVS